jgi:hypothetical protein
VGWVTTPATLAALAHRGRLVVISAVGSRKVEIDLIDLYHNETGSSARTAQSSVSLNPHGAWCSASICLGGDGPTPTSAPFSAATSIGWPNTPWRA